MSLSGVYDIPVRMRITLTPTGYELPAIRHVKEEMKRQIEVRWNMNTIDTSSPLLLSAALDPRFKGMNYLDTEKVKRVKSHIARMCAEDIAKLDQKESEPHHKMRKTEMNAWDILLGDEEQPIDSNNSRQQECDSYWAEKTRARDGDPLKWWSVKQEAYPSIARLAKRLLCIPATSAASERVFSTTGNTITQLRNSLSGNTVESLIFLSMNAGLLSSID